MAAITTWAIVSQDGPTVSAINALSTLVLSGTQVLNAWRR
jgi:hypothetical protein